MKTIVIGTDHGGTAVVRMLKKMDPKMEVVTYDQGTHVSTLACATPLWIKGVYDDESGLSFASVESLTKEGIQVHTQTRWTGINPQAKEVRFEDLKTKQTITDHYDKLVIASGSSPLVPPFKGMDTCVDVSGMKNYENAQKLHAVNKDARIKKVVVIGGGFIGVELVDAFVAGSKEVTLIDIAPTITPNSYDELFTSKIEQAMKKDGVKLQLGESVQEFISDKDGHLKQVKTDKGVYAADFAVVCVGVKVNTELLKGVVDLNERGAIKTNEYLQTSNPDIYTLGDAAEVYNPAYQAKMPVQLASVAIRTGIIVATNIVKGNTLKANLGFTSANALNIFGWYLASCGITEAMAKKNKINYGQITLTDVDFLEVLPGRQLVTIKIVFDKTTRRLIGAQIGSRNNHTEMIHMLALAIQKELTIDELPFVDMFFLPQVNKTYSYVMEAALREQGLEFYAKHADQENK